MAEIRKFQAVRAVVRPDRREDYLRRFGEYVAEARGTGADVRLFEDHVLPGRFLELTEHIAAEGMESRLRSALGAAGLKAVCVRREGDEILYREVEVEA